MRCNGTYLDILATAHCVDDQGTAYSGLFPVTPNGDIETHFSSGYWPDINTSVQNYACLKCTHLDVTWYDVESHWLLDPSVCPHLDFADNLTGATCNDCGTEVEVNEEAF